MRIQGIKVPGSCDGTDMQGGGRSAERGPWKAAQESHKIFNYEDADNRHSKRSGEK